MSGGRSPKRKGTREEQELVRQLIELGLMCSRVPLSDADGGEYVGDIRLEMLGRVHCVEVKASREFRTLHSWLTGRDLLLLKGDRQVVLAVLPLSLLAELAASVKEASS
jgi:hypothetical protein